MVDTTGIRVSIEGDRAIADAKRLDTALERLGRQGTQTETAFGKLRNSSTKTAGAFDRFKNSVFSAQSALKGLAVAGIAQQIGAAALATERITNALKFATGSAQGAADALKFVRSESDRLGLAATSTAQAFSGIAAAAQGTALQGDAVREIFLGVAEASSALSLSADNTQGALLALSQMISKGTVQAEELRGQLGERIPGAFQIAARAMGVTTEELGKMLEQGQVISEDFLPKFAAEMRRSFGDAATEASKGLQAAINRLTNAYDELLRTLAETGVIDAATRIISNLGTIVYNTATIFTNAKTAVFEFFDQFRDTPQTLSGTAAKLDLLSKKIVKLSEQRAVSPFPKQIDERIAELRAEYDRVQKVFSELSSKPITLEANKPAGIEPPPTPPSQALAVLRAQLDKVSAATTQYNERIALLKKELAAGNIEQSEFNKLAGLAKGELDKVISSANAAKGSIKGYAVELTALERAQAKFNDAIANYPARQVVRELEEEFLAQEQVFTEGARLQEEAQDKVNRKLEESKQFVRDLGLTFSSSFEEAILKGNSLSDVLKGLAQDILAITTRKLVTNPFAEAVGQIAGGLGGMFGGTPAPTAPHVFGPKVRFAHQGGIIGVDAMPSRSVSPNLFDNAPRLHNGGLLSGEIPAILKRGEEVLPANHPRHQNNQNSQGSNVHIEIIDQRTADSPPVQVTQSQGPNGERQIKALIVETMKQSMGTGELDRTFANNFGLRRPGVSR